MKKIAVFLLAFMLLLPLSACGDFSAASQADEKEGLRPYEFTDEDKDLLGALGLDDSAMLFSFQVPAATKKITLHYKLLQEDGTWMSFGKCEIDAAEEMIPDVQLEGTAAVVTEMGSDLSLHLTTPSRGSSLMPRDDPGFSGSIERSALASFQEIEMGREIPLVIITYEEGDDVTPFTVADYFDPAVFADADAVQAVTLTFSDEV